jgi:hypothetical protein
MIKIDKKTKDQLLEMYKTKKISLEGNILKVIDPDGDVEFEAYIKESIEKDKDVSPQIPKIENPNGVPVLVPNKHYPTRVKVKLPMPRIRNSDAQIDEYTG